MSATNRTAVQDVRAWRTRGGLQVRDVRYAAGARQARHCHAQGSISLVLAGELEEETSGMTYRAAVGSLVVKPADHWHANAYGPRGTRVVQLLPAADGFSYGHAARGYRWIDAPRVARSMFALMERGDDAETAEADLWDALGHLASDGDQVQRSIPRWWSDAVDLLDACATQSISVTDVARRVGVHPVHLARVCRRQFGCTVQQYIRQRRVLAAWRAWERGEGPLSAIAARAGFADQAHMTRSFAAVLGVAPGRLRRITRFGG